MGHVEMKCEECGHEMKVGDYPFCPHPPIHERNATVAPPTVVFRNVKGEYKFPGRDTDKPPRGYQRVELNTQRSRDKFEREMNARETQKLHDVEYGRREAYKATLAEHRDKLLAIKNQSSSEYTKRFVDLCIADGERRLAQSIRGEAGFHIESNNFDASNRPAWNDKDTGWKDRK